MLTGMTTLAPPVCTPEDLRAAWRSRINGPLGPFARRIWIGFVDPDRRMYRNMTHWRIGPRPRQRTVDDMLGRLRGVLDGLEPGTTVALLLTRPGHGPVSDADRQWCTLLTATAARLGVPIEPVFRANEDAVALVECAVSDDPETAPDIARPVHPYSPLPAETLDDPVHSDADLGQRWRTLMGDPGFGERLIWFGFVDSRRRMVKVLHQMSIPREPKPRHGDELFTLLRGVLDGLPDPDSTAALLITRPGRCTVTDTDRRWSTMLTEAAARHRVPIEPIFLANDEALVLLAERPTGT